MTKKTSRGPPGWINLGATPKNVGVSGPESFILNHSGGEEICSVAVPCASAIVQGAAAAGPPARK